MGRSKYHLVFVWVCSDHLRIYGPLQNRYESESGGRGGTSMTNAIYHVLVYGRLRPNGLVTGHITDCKLDLVVYADVCVVS